MEEVNADQQQKEENLNDAKPVEDSTSIKLAQEMVTDVITEENTTNPLQTTVENEPTIRSQDGEQIDQSEQIELQNLNLEPSFVNNLEITDDNHLTNSTRPATSLNNSIVDSIDPHEMQYLEQKQKKKESLKQSLTDVANCSKSYYEISEKEQIVLNYVDNFNRQYTHLFPGRKALLLSPPNEFGVKKFICTTIRPTQLPYKELYDYNGCARFVADYLSYIPLDPPHELPATIPSPTYTLKIQEGNCFDLSVLLTSLLRGVGYDAYVVSGYASQDITLMDETKTDVAAMEMMAAALGFHSNYRENENFWMIGEEIEKVTNTDDKLKQQQQKKKSNSKPTSGKSLHEDHNSLLEKQRIKYKIKPQKKLTSQFLLKSEQKKQILEKSVAEKKRIEVEIQNSNNDDDEDELKGLRIHAWVLVLPGKREVAEAFFIESSTGKIYSTENKNFLGVESVFNSANYWVNMQVCYDGMKGISLDLGDNSKWEFVLLDNTQPGATGNKNEQDEEEEEEDNNTEILDLPKSWVDRLTISKEDFQTRCPSGTKTIIFKSARLEMFAEYHRDDGMVARISFFANEEEKFNGEIKELFKNRKDKLWQRIRTPHIDKIHEYFEPGRPHGLKNHIIIEGKTKEMHFYSSARSDGLVKRVDEFNKVIEYFTSRDDRLIYRSVTFETHMEAEGEQRLPHKLTEKFERNPNIPASEDPAKKTCFLKEEKIRIVYHLEDGRIIPSFKEFKKPTAEQKGNFMDLTNGFEVDPYVPLPKKQHLCALLHQLVRGEQSCLQAIKGSDREMKEILIARKAEEKEITLAISVYDTIRNNSKFPSEEEKEAHKGEQEELKAADLDYLSPFLVNKIHSEKLSKEDAMQVRDACLKSMKERLVERANIIQSRLDEVSAEYQRRQLAYSRNADMMTVEETEEYVKFCNNALFKIHILEKRLAKHKEAAPDRYEDLDNRLHADRRLAAAYLQSTS
ncbi:hypothetical protein HK099_003463 [Clydaea vesicula]|uniref:Dynein regulatory complex subunit 7 n=1 Tax=Clydaea vesicula TaxID=447962 RepID=A0AAD5U212_9FUNG|nr:hypothetical protein HK099_003463 [Clydaea vesicula]